MARSAAIATVGLFQKPGSEPARQVARELCACLQAKGLRVLADPEAARSCDLPAQPRAELAEKSDLLLVLGGDGTLLAAAREAGERAAPILGVNLGALGFLAEINPDEAVSALERVLAGDFETQARMRLRVHAQRDDETLLSSLALNDAVLTRSDLSRMIDIEALSDGAPISRYHGDGLIVATPTGSTAYTLSAGGPLLLPGARVIALTPICPHALSQRPLVLPDDVALELVVHRSEGAALLTVDGQLGVNLSPGDRVRVSADAPPAVFVIAHARTRFHALRAKLGWGQR